MTLRSSEQVAGAIDSNDALLVITIPSDFDSLLARGETAPVQVILDGRNSSTAGTALGQISAITAAYNLTQGASAPVSIVRRAWHNPNLQSRWTLMPALIAGLSLMQTLLVAALSVASTSWPAVAPCAGVLVHTVQLSPVGQDGLFPV